MCSSTGSLESGLPNTKESQQAVMRILCPMAAHHANHSGAIILAIFNVCKDLIFFMKS